ncbi:AsmA family protein [Flavobacterium silvaticum]|uniref:AsmA family protein n=1 Tax=Flavobacterium silvaticum TaxID=1852020 RepID=A0A972FRD4_9FLAO|nr:AsmA-like C-terminal region-containing protein [Flavobacterium silvaticum]NMH27098.1 AsmA family protein [Flavobacterium silvaticum]
MKKITDKARKSFQKRHWWKWILGIIVGTFLFLGIVVGAAAWYVKSHGPEIKEKLLAKLNENLDGELVIGQLVPEFFNGFPNLSLRLEDVHLKDKKFASHHKELLKAGSVEISVNAMALLRKKIDIVKIGINDASVYILTDSTGYSNTAIFKSKDNKPDGTRKSMPQLRRFSMQNVKFTADNQLRNKLFVYDIKKLKGGLDYHSGGFSASAGLRTFAESMSFNKSHGSFMDHKMVEGNFDVDYDSAKKELVVNPRRLDIGGEKFIIGAKFTFGDKSAPFEIHLITKEIVWKNASGLLANNIREKLDMFAIEKPIFVTCDIVGDLSSEQDPLILVKAKCRDNTLHSPGGNVYKCAFDGLFTNRLVAGKGTVDENSSIILTNFSGEYGTIPFKMSRFSIDNLVDPIAKGKVSGNFPVDRINSVIDKELLLFKSGTAAFNVDFVADINNYKLIRPLVKGKVDVIGGELDYVPRNMKFRNVNIDLLFTDQELQIRKLGMNTGKSVFNVSGQIDNFLKLYYNDPKLLKADISLYSQEFFLAEMLSYIEPKKAKKKVVKKPGNFTNELAEFIDQSNLNIALKVDKLHFRNFLASDVRAKVTVSDEKIQIQNTRLNHADGTMIVHGLLNRGQKTNPYTMDATITGVNIRKFFGEFDNFGMKTLTGKNLSGKFYMTAKLNGNIRENGTLQPNSMQGTVDFTLKKGGLQHFEPLKNIGKFAFPHRNLDTILFKDLSGSFTFKGDKVHIAPLFISSSLLNMDISGTYSFGKGTLMYVDVPLRDPKRDKGITNAEELAKRRNRGVVVHLLAADDDKTGDVKIKLALGKNRNQNKEEP